MTAYPRYTKNVIEFPCFFLRDLLMCLEYSAVKVIPSEGVSDPQKDLALGTLAVIRGISG